MTKMLSYFQVYFTFGQSHTYKLIPYIHGSIYLLQECNYVLEFSIQTDPTFNLNSFIRSFQHLTSQKIVPCLRWMLYFTLPHKFPWSPRGVLTVLTKSSWSPHGVFTESTESSWSPHGVHGDSMRTLWTL